MVAKCLREFAKKKKWSLAQVRLHFEKQIQNISKCTVEYFEMYKQNISKCTSRIFRKSFKLSCLEVYPYITRFPQMCMKQTTSWYAISFSRLKTHLSKRIFRNVEEEYLIQCLLENTVRKGRQVLNFKRYFPFSAMFLKVDCCLYVNFHFNRRKG